MKHGKSTLLKFISACLYGVNRNKSGKEISDYERYRPWNNMEYSGKLTYLLDNNARYEVYRDFTKKNPKIYNEKSEELTKEYSVDKNKGSEFFKEQTGIEEELLMATNVISQEETRLDKPKQNLLIQKITNLISAGEDNVSYKKTIDKLAKKILEEVGTERTTERPINIIENNLRKLEKEKIELEENKIKKIELENVNKKIKKEREEKIKELEMVKEIKRKKEEENIENEIIKINNKSLNEIEEKIEKINQEKINQEKNEQEKNRKNNRGKRINNNSRNKTNGTYLLITAMILILTVASFLINLNLILNYTLLFLTISVLIFSIIKINKNKKILIKIQEEKNTEEKEKNILENMIKEKVAEINKLEKQKEEKILIQKLQIKNKYYLSEKILEDYFACTIEEIENIIEKKENEIKLADLKIHEAEIENKNILEKLEKAAQFEEEIQNLKTKKQELNSLANSIQIAKQTIEEAYEEMKNKITPQFTQDLGTAAQKISQGKYKNVKFSDETGLTVEKENGEYINANLLSTGTINQMYLALRLSMASQISEEKIPIILDEVFAYYDDGRLESSLKYLAENYEKYQIIILTCSDREKRALETMQIPYNEVIM